MTQNTTTFLRRNPFRPALLLAVVFASPVPVAAADPTGEQIYKQQCARCHGPKAEGDIGPVLVGGQGTLRTARPLKTVGSFWPYATTLWDYINRAMPFDKPGLLKPSEVYAVAAYILNLNGIIGEGDVMDAKTLPKVRMPNRDGFVPDPRPDVGEKARKPN